MQRNFKIDKWYVSPGHKIIKEILSLGDEQFWGTSVKAAVSDWNIQDLPVFDDLRQQIHALYSDYKIEELWSAVYRQGDYAQNHCHPGFDYSFVWYLDTCRDCSPLVFPDVEHPWMPPLHVHRPKVGELLVFSGNSHHYVTPHICSHERIVVSGNLVPVKKEATWEPGYYQ